MNLILFGGFAVLGLLIMFGLLYLLNWIERKPSRGRKLAGRPETTLKDFAQRAGEIQVSLRIARETYDVLLQYYPTPMCINLQDDLRRDLELTEDSILQFRSSVLMKTDRLEPGNSDVSVLITVSDLLLNIETAERSKADRAALRLRAGDCPYPVRPVVEVIEFKQTSEIIDPDYLRRQHFRWLRRRLSDYKGLLSRATDEVAKPSHQGPFRRSREAPFDPSKILEQRTLKPKKVGDGVSNLATQNNEESTTVSAPRQAARFSDSPIRVSGPEYPTR